MGLNLKKALGGFMVGGPTGGVIGGLQRGKGARSTDGTVPKAMPGGMANYYDDSWAQLLAGMQAGEGTTDVLQRILTNFKGKPGNLEDFLRQAGPFLGAAQVNKLGQSPGLKFMEDQSNWDMGALGAYGQGAGMIGRGARQSIDAGNQQLAAAGLGRSAARGSQTAALRQQAYGQQAGLWSDTYQQAQRNRMASANNLFDAHRVLAQLAMGQVPTPRNVDSGAGANSLQDSLGALASGVGAGAAIGGPIGGLVGGALFGGAKMLGHG